MKVRPPYQVQYRTQITDTGTSCTKGTCLSSLLDDKMGALLSYLVGETQEDDEEVSLLALLENDDQNMELVWNAIQLRLRSHPEEAAAYARSIDTSPLQRALQLAQRRRSRMPVNVAKLFLAAYEDAVYDTPASGETSLYMAVRGAAFSVEDDSDSASEIVKLLLECHPEAASRCARDGRLLLPIHHVRNDPEIATVLLQAYPLGSVAQDAEGRIPLHHCCSGIHARRPSQQTGDNEEEPDQGPHEADAHLSPTNPKVVAILIGAAKQQGVADGGVLMRDQKDTTPLDLMCQEVSGALEEKGESKGDDLTPCILDDSWESLTILVQEVAPEECREPFRMVHAVIALDCPPVVIAHAVKLYPQQACERDSKGRTPLMVAALSSDRTHPSVICTLLKCHPESACMTDDDGRLPIDIIAEASQYDEELWEAIVKAEPRAVDTRDLRDKMFPFLTAAIGEKSNVNTVYCLLRAKPHVLSYFDWK